jgi:hypothetical protein
VVAGLVVASLLSVPSVSFFLQRRTILVLGPVLILAGVVMLGWLRLRRFAGPDVTLRPGY